MMLVFVVKIAVFYFCDVFGANCRNVIACFYKRVGTVGTVNGRVAVKTVVSHHARSVDVFVVPYINCYVSDRCFVCTFVFFAKKKQVAGLQLLESDIV